MTLFCGNNMTSNIQHGVTSHYPSVSGGATAKSLEGMEIGMGCTIGVPRTSQWRTFAEGRSPLKNFGINDVCRYVVEHFDCLMRLFSFETKR